MPTSASASLVRPVGRRPEQAVQGGLQDRFDVVDRAADRGDGQHQLQDLFEGQFAADLTCALRIRQQGSTGIQDRRATRTEEGLAVDLPQDFRGHSVFGR